MLKRRCEILDDNLEGEMILLLFSCDDASGVNGFKAKPAPFVHVKSLESMIQTHLDAHER